MGMTTRSSRSLASRETPSPVLACEMSKWFYDTFTGAAQEQPAMVLLWGISLVSWLLALGERGGDNDLCGSGRLSIIPYIHEKTELYCAQAYLT
jgi:hypothetical protein